MGAAPEGNPVVCEACGVIHDDATARIAQLQKDLENAERELRSKRRKIGELTDEQYARLTAHERFDDAMDVLKFWQETLAPNARELKGRRRLQPTIERLAEYTPAELKRCILGYRQKPFMVRGRRSPQGTLSERRVDPDLIFRDAKHVEMGLDFMREAELVADALSTKSNGHVESVPISPISSEGPGTRISLYVTNLGFSVFPCEPGKKTPATMHGFKDATQDVTRICRYWEQVPDANVAVATGRPSGIVVIDVDSDEHLDGMASLRRLEGQFGELPPTLSAVTPRGGQHFYFQWPGVEIYNRAGIKEGIDVRGDGGYVLLPPSSVNGSSYEWDERASIAQMPQWLLEPLIRSQQETMNGGHDDEYWAHFVSSGASSGDRNDRMTRFVGHLFGKGHEVLEVLELARVLNGNVHPKLPDKELNKIVQSIARRRAHQLTLA